MYDESTSVKKVANLVFIDRDTYSRLSDHAKIKVDILDLINNGNAGVSELITDWVKQLNRKLSCLVSDFGPVSSSSLGSAQNQEYHKAQYETFAASKDNFYGDNEKCYEIVACPGNGSKPYLLAVLNNGFLKRMSESKEEFEEFLLACLRLGSSQSFDISTLLRSYGRVKTDVGAYTLTVASCQ
jgi:hypothetical protein